jgi:low affinity Fe/Cu permease
MKEFFRKFSQKTSELVGSPGAFFASVLLLVIWAVLGPVFHYSDTWQLVINTITTVITFLIVFLIQNSQNREAKALHLKLDELIRSIKTARNSMVDLEDLSDDELDHLQKQFKRISDRYAKISGDVDDVAEKIEKNKSANRKE